MERETLETIQHLGSLFLTKGHGYRRLEEEKDTTATMLASRWMSDLGIGLVIGPWVNSSMLFLSKAAHPTFIFHCSIYRGGQHFGNAAGGRRQV